MKNDDWNVSTEKLSPNTEMLIIAIEHLPTGRRFSVAGKLRGGGWQYALDGDMPGTCSQYKVIGWKPLPEPPLFPATLSIELVTEDFHALPYRDRPKLATTAIFYMSAACQSPLNFGVADMMLKMSGQLPDEGPDGRLRWGGAYAKILAELDGLNSGGGNRF